MDTTYQGGQQHGDTQGRTEDRNAEADRRQNQPAGGNDEVQGALRNAADAAKRGGLSYDDACRGLGRAWNDQGTESGGISGR